ncbi:NAD(P)H-dependent oxidoreductase [Rhodococcus sp. H29-C3]|uniref:NAD(P)H-dependent oxidoreductase n=1 Tax=Rhodococcus sp. H29-C3 TaxID=3046307 RepID=UPI0024BB7BEC|nr:NAD(P)H-dependent oxidoreductase [Rhodococcus sp. H29-C3]MDJ0362518.1 NAD(P)H-dependent oxidoreductase [Rhodococcus sp. H29-C3]
MIVLVVTAHPGECSLTSALSAVTRTTLADAGHIVIESDFYAMAWGPALREEQFGTETVKIERLP